MLAEGMHLHDFFRGKEMFQEGDLVKIPLPNGENAIGRIVHISRHFKDSIGVVVLGLQRQVVLHDGQAIHGGEVLGPLYTNIIASRHYGWETIGHSPMTEADRALTKRIVGGGVYIMDDFLGSPDESEAETIPTMRVYGMPLVWAEILKRFQSSTHESSVP